MNAALETQAEGLHEAKTSALLSACELACNAAGL
jgi:hypothetical protein